MLLLWIVAKIHFASGGSLQLGTMGATVLRLALTVIVLGPATLLMGGTLPAPARAIETTDDTGRRAVALLYGINTLGAVAGTLLSTLFMALLVNVLVGVVARAMPRGGAAGFSPPEADSGLKHAGSRQRAKARRSTGRIYIASALTGFAFVLARVDASLAAHAGLGARRPREQRRARRRCHLVNAGAMSNRRVHVTIADAREMLLTSRSRYDLICL